MASVSKRQWTHKGVTKEAWVLRYKDRGGAHRSRQFERKKDAEAFKRQVEGELDAGLHVARSQSLTVAHVIAEFTEEMETRHSEGQVGYGMLINTRQYSRYIIPTIGGILLRDLRWQDVVHLADCLKKTETRFKRPLAAKTRVNIIDFLSTAVGFGVRRGYAARNVVTDAKREMGPTRCRKIETFTRDEIRQLLLSLETRAPFTKHRPYAQVKAMVYLACVCGLRRGEIRGLTAAHLDFDRGIVHVRQAVDQWDNLKTTKTRAGIRDVPMPPAVAAVVRSYVEVAVPDDRGLLFRSFSGKALYEKTFSTMWHAALTRAGFEPDAQGRWRHFHALRHFAGSAWLAGGIPLAEVSKMLGHANTGVTAEVYSHAIVDVLERRGEIAAMAQALLPSPVTQELRKA